MGLGHIFVSLVHLLGFGCMLEILFDPFLLTGVWGLVVIGILDVQ